MVNTKLAGKVTTTADKATLEDQLRIKKKGNKASRISDVAQAAAAKGVDWRKEANRRVTKGFRKEDNVWRKSIKRGK